MQSVVSLVFENDRSALLKLQKIRVASAHRDLVEPRDVQPFGLFEETQMTEEQKEKLSLPVRFRYERGFVSDVEFDSNDESWSENVKRAVINMLQINLAKKARTDDSEMRRLMREPESTEFPEKDYFTTQEMTLEGDCETSYTVVPAGQEMLRVSKSLNFDKCAKRVDIRYNYRFGEECSTSCEKKFTGEEKNTQSATTLKFELNGDVNNFLIREVELRSHYLFAPLSQEQGHMATFVANKLTLVKIDTNTDRVSQPRSEKKETLVYSTEWEEKVEQFHMTGEESLLRESPFPWMSKKVEIARKIVEEIKSEISKNDREQESFTPALNHQVARLVEVLRLCTKEEIKRVAHEMTQEKQLASIFYDVLAVAGTKNTIEHIVEKIVEREVSPLKASRIMKELMNVRNPSEKIVDILVRLAKEEVCERNPVLKQSTWLTIGSLLNGMCSEKRERFALEVSFEKNGKKSICSRQVKEKYVQLLENLFEKSETRYEKILALKTIANSGMDLIVYPLEKIIKNEREEKIVRIQAIDALRKLRSVMPRKLHNILMPIFKNVREFPELRVAAFHQIMHTIPERAVIDQITQQLQYERSTQVHAYVYSTLKSLAKSDIPCEKDMARDIELSLRLARVQPRKLMDSHLLRASLYDNEYFTGAAVNWAMLFTNDSVLPKEVMASLDTVFAGQWNKYLAQIGFAQQNIDQVLYKLLERIEDSESTLDEVVVRGKRAAPLKPAEALRKLMEKMGIQQRRHSEKEAHAMLYLRYKDMDYAVLPIDEQSLPNLFKDVIKGGKIHLGEMERILSKGYRFSTEIASFLYETTRIIPTTLGLPLEITGKLPTVLSVEGHIQLELDPQSGNGVNGLRLKLQAKPEISSTHVTHMEIRSPLVSSGVKILHSAYFQLPIDVLTEMNWEKKFDVKVTIKAPESRDQKRVLSLNTRPVTYIRHESSPKKMESAVEKTVFLAEQPVTEIDNVYGEKALGVRFVVRGNVHRHLLEKLQQGKTLPIFVCQNQLEVVLENGQETPREYVIRMSVSAFDEEKMRTEQPEFENFYEKELNEHFEVEDSEYLKENEMERQSAFNKYVKGYKSSSSGRSTYSHRVHIKTEAVGSSVERSAEMEIKSVCDETFTFCKWILEASRSPLLQGERRQWTLSASLQTLFPEPVMSLKQLHEQKHRELTATLNAKWGSEQKNSLKLRVQGEQSKEQQKWQELTIRKADKQEQQQSVENLENLVLASRLNQLKIVADYSIVPETQVQFSRVSSLLKAWAPLSADVEPRLTEKSFEQQGRMLAKLTVEPQTWRYLNFSMETPAEKMELENIRLPIRPTWVSIEKSQAVHNVRDISRRLSSEPMCEVSSDRVNTFDEVVYRAPLTTCYSVLAKDCSSEPNFAVLMKNVDKKSEEKKIKIVTEQREIEIEMNKRGDLIVKIDGKTIKETEQLEKYNLEKRGDVIIFENEDIFVRFDGYKAEIKLNQYYKNQQCGMCGHYDGEYEGEFRRADNEETENIEEFHRSFLSRDDECDMEEEKLSKKENYKKFEKKSVFGSEESSEEDSFFSDKRQRQYKQGSRFDEEETVEPEEKTRVIEYSNKVCFSKQPVPECPERTREAEEKDMKVNFACLERSSSQARRLLRESRNEILSIEELPHSFVETLSVPQKCVVY